MGETCDTDTFLRSATWRYDVARSGMTKLASSKTKSDDMRRSLLLHIEILLSHVNGMT